MSNQNVSDDFRMVTFSLGAKAYGIDIMQVKEISSARRFTYVPNTAGYVRGLFNLRGEIIPVIDMRLFFNLEIEGENAELDITRNNEIYEALVILTFGHIDIGIIVDNINHVITIAADMIQHSHPLFAELDVPYIDGIVDYKNQLYIILAMDKIIDPYLELGEQAAFDLNAILEGIAKIRNVQHPPLIPAFPNEQAPHTAETVARGWEVSSSAESTENPSAENGAENGVAQNRVGESLPEILEEKEEQRESDKTELEEEPGQGIPTEPTLLSGNAALRLALEEEGFFVTPLNARAVEQKWQQWPNAAEVNQENWPRYGKEFLRLLKSQNQNQYWTDTARQAVARYFTDHCGNLNVWHAGCGSGRETYSLAALLVGAAPEANLQVRAAESDLLAVAEAPLQKVESPSELPEWLREYLSPERGSDGYPFAKSLRDRIIFEYQDVLHSTPHTKAELIVMRDLLSRYSEAEQEHILRTIEDSIQKDGLVIVGDNEDLDAGGWELLESEPLKIYRRRVS
ncbi:MAG: CheR family methyltransferase [Spirochaetota bacterium]